MRSSITATLREGLLRVARTSKVERAWWEKAYESAELNVSLEETLESLEGVSPQRLEALMTEELPPWHLLLLGAALDTGEHTHATPRGKRTFVVGDLHVPEPLRLNGSLVVTGNLTVDGPVLNSVEKGVVLVVGGTLRTTAIVSCEGFAVGRDCFVRDLVLGYERRHPFVVRGRFETPLLVLADGRPHRFGKARVGTTVLDPDETALREHFDPQLIVDGEFRIRELIRRLSKGVPFSA